MKNKAESESTERSYSTTGRPRRLTDLQIAEILAWYQSRLTNREVAQRYGIARGTLENIVRTHGTHYKQAPPERRVESLEARRIHRAKLIEQDLL
jgi:transposase